MAQADSFSVQSSQKALMIKQKPKSHVYNIRHCCDVIGCAVTFTRSYDLIRHKRTVHGPKVKCQYSQCSYATARSDKMKEHNRKKHLDRSKLFNKACKFDIPNWCSDAPWNANEILGASAGIGNNEVYECSWYANGLEMNELWTGTANPEVWTDIAWNPFWMMTA